MTTLYEENSLCDISDDETDSTIVDYNNLTQEEKEELELDTKVLEKGKHIIYRRISKKLPDGSLSFYNKKVRMYSTRCNPGALIRDPVHGSYFKERVGTSGEYYYFKVRMVDYYTDEREGITLFYDSPEGYEKHQFTKLSMDVKNRWHKRYLEFTGNKIASSDSPKRYTVVK